MKRFHYAIKAIENEMLRSIGKVATKHFDRGHDPMLALQENKVLNMKKAIKILEEHKDNVHV
jgi:hypothetical protein